MMNKADLDVSKSYPMSLGDKRYYWEQWFNKTFTKHHWIFISWDKCDSKPNYTVAILENILEMVRIYPILWYMFWVYLEPD